MKKLLVILAFLSAGVLVCAQAATYKDVTVPDTVTLGGQSLVLNGMGLRTKFFFKIYVGALYLPQKANTTEAVLAQSGPDRILMHMIYDVSKEQFADAWNEGFHDNNPGMSEAVQSGLVQFLAYFGSSKKGDVITLDYIPGQGTQISWNGEFKGNIPGEDFHKALLNVFLGPKPPTKSLKEGLLGKHG
ncbi:MAG: chalcone isomerase family protein [Gammaproteobacteria bacterium]|nr:chalcone isomerase family protein [Gammaproteobacteria bacterium]